MADGFQRILCPIDFSKHCDEALTRAAWFANLSQAEVYLMHVVANPADPLYAPQEVSYWEMVEHADKKAAELLEEVAQRCLPAACRRRLIVRQGDPYAKLIEEVTAADIDLIVMSTHGRTGLAHLVLGSVAEKLLRHAPCPMFVVRRPASKNR